MPRTGTGALLEAVVAPNDAIAWASCAVDALGGSAARVCGGNTIDHPGRSDLTHRVTDECIEGGVVLVDLEIAGSVLHQHFVLAGSAERTKADDMEIAADRTNEVCR